MRHGLSTTGAVLAAQAVRFLGTLVLAATLVRLFGADGYGRYAAAVALAGQFSFLADLGIPLLLRQRVGPNNLATARPYVLLALAGVGAMLLISVILGTTTNRFAASFGLQFAVTAAVGLGGFQTTLGALLQLSARAPIEAALAALDRGGAVLLAILVGAAFGSLTVVAAALLAWRVIITSIGFGYLPGVWGTPTLSNTSAFAIVRSGIPYASNVLATAVYQSADVVMMGFLFPPTQVGYYAAATTIFIPLTAVAAATAVTTQLQLAALYQEGRTAEAAQHTRLVNTWLLLLGGLLGIAVAGNRVLIASLVFGDRSGIVSWYLLLLSLILPLRYLNNSLATTLTASGQQRGRSIAVAIAAVFNVVANIIALPVLGPRGAVYTTILTEFVISIAIVVAIWTSRKERVVTMIPAPLAWMVALILGLGITFVAPSTVAPPLTALAAAVFVTFLHLTRAVRVGAIVVGVKSFLESHGV